MKVKKRKFTKEVQTVLNNLSEYPKKKKALDWFIWLDKRIRKMKKDGTWDKLDSFYLYSGSKKEYDPPNEEIALINWKEPDVNSKL